jgi:DNA-binding IclR family transcriptional regulator
MPGNSTAVAAVDRAIALLSAFTERDVTLSLSELARRTSLDKSTALRIARTLAGNRMLVQGEDSSWRLGPKLAQLGARYTASFVPEKFIAPELSKLSEETGESAAIYVREGDSRVCLLRSDSAQSIRHSAHIGDAMPLDKGAAGWVILSFGGHVGDLCQSVRERGYHLTRGERTPDVASLAVPLFGADNTLFGSLALTGPLVRFTDEAAQQHLPRLQDAATTISGILGAEARPVKP